MRLPTLTDNGTSRDITQTFAGYNHNLTIADGEFYDMKNLSSTHFPVLSPRGKRGVYASPENPQGLISKDALCYIDGSKFVMNEHTVDLGLSVEAADCPKTLVSMGAYVIILPDKKYINTADISDYGSIEAEKTTVSYASFSMCRIDGTDFGEAISSPAEPESKDNGDYWIDTSSTPHTLKQYSETSGMWVTIPTTYIKIVSEGIGSAFSQYDGVTVSINRYTDQSGKYKDHDNSDYFDDKDLDEIDGSFVIWEKGDNYIVILGRLDQARTVDNVITVTRKMPKMDFVIESNNRLWGCRYGDNGNGKIVNEIYASKLGDFKNWNCFMGLSTDSYTASCGTDGQWTGAFTYLGYPTFFKENYLHKVYGNYPSNYQIQDTACRGVEKGSSRSLAMVGEVLYYKSSHGVCAYSGSLPAEVSAALGDVRYSDAVACSYGNKYYVSMKDAAGEYTLFVYDTKRGMWFKEDNASIDAFAECRNDLYFIDHADHKIKTIGGSGTKETALIEWMAETGAIGMAITNKKYVSKMVVRMSLDVGSSVRILIQYDSMGEWESICSMSTSSLKSFTIPIRPKRCDHFRLRIVGTGDAKIFSISKTIEQGSDI